jgi:hypothetical protein
VKTKIDFSVLAEPPKKREKWEVGYPTTITIVLNVEKVQDGSVQTRNGLMRNVPDFHDRGAKCVCVTRAGNDALVKWLNIFKRRTREF